MFGFSNQNAVDGPDVNTGARNLTITLDLTPAGGYNGTSNFGTVTWADSVLGTIGTFTYTTTRDFGSVFISGANPFTGAISNLSLTQILPIPTFESWISGFGIAPTEQQFNADPDRDGVASGIEHVFGTNPNGFTQGITEVSATASTLTFRNPLNAAIAGTVGYGYEWSTDLTDWRSSGELNNGGTRATVTNSAPDTNGMVTVIITITQGPGGKLFGRVVAERF